MIDFGTKDPQVAAMLLRALAIIDGPIAELTIDLFAEEGLDPTSEIHRLNEQAPAGPLDVWAAIGTATSAAIASVRQISDLLQGAVPTWRIVPQALLRTALVGSARVAYVLLPPDPQVRLARAGQMLALDCGSGVKALKQFTEFQGLAAMTPPRQLLDDLTAQRQRLAANVGQLPEGKVVAGMVEALIDSLAAADPAGEFSPEILRDHGQWLWNAYSGLAHAYSWPRLLPTIAGDRRIPGDFPFDLHQVAGSVHVAVLATLQRGRPGTALTTEDISLR